MFGGFGANPAPLPQQPSFGGFGQQQQPPFGHGFGGQTNNNFQSNFGQQQHVSFGQSAKHIQQQPPDPFSQQQQQQHVPFGQQAAAAPFGQQAAAAPFGQQQQPVPFGQQQPVPFGQQSVPFGQPQQQPPQRTLMTNPTSKSLFIHIPPNTQLEDVRAYLSSAFGPVESLTTRPNHPLQLYADMENAEDAQRAVEFGGPHPFPDMRITINKFAKTAAAAIPNRKPSFDHFTSTPGLDEASPKSKTSLFIYAPPNMQVEDVRQYLTLNFGSVVSISGKPGHATQMFAEMQNADASKRAVEYVRHPKGLTIIYNKFPRTINSNNSNNDHAPTNDTIPAFTGDTMEEDTTVAAAAAAPRSKIADIETQKAELRNRIAEKTKRTTAATAAAAAPAPVEAVNTPIPNEDTTPQPQEETFVVGTCTRMCPESETQARIDANQIDLLERSDNVFNTAIMKFQRSAANETMNNPEIIRTEETLVRTLDYLWNNILDIDSDENQPLDRRGNAPTLVSIISFITDRTKRIRQELDMQGFTSGGGLRKGTLKILEECVRFHILVSHEMCEKKSDEEGFNAKLNREDMNACFKKLFALYDRGMQSDCELEMRAYYVVLMIDSNDRVSANTMIKEADMRFRGKAQSALFDLSLQVYDAFVSGDYYFYFSTFRNTEHYLLACLMHSGMNKMRIVALNMINDLHYVQNDENLGRFPVQRITQQFCFDSTEATVEFLEQYAQRTILVDGNEEEYVVLNKRQPVEFHEPLETRKSMLLEQKRGARGKKRRDFVTLGNANDGNIRMEQEKLEAEMKRRQAAEAAAEAERQAEAQRQQRLVAKQAEAQKRLAAEEAARREASKKKQKEEQERFRLAAEQAAAEQTRLEAFRKQQEEEQRQREAAAAAATAQKRFEEEQQRRNAKFGALLEQFNQKRPARLCLREWNKQSELREMRTAQQANVMANLLERIVKRRAFRKLIQALQRSSKPYSFPMLFNPERLVDVVKDKRQRLSNSTALIWPAHQVFPSQLRYCLVRFDSDLVSCEVSRFARWCAGQMPNLVMMITPESCFSQQNLREVDLVVVVWSSKSQQEVNKLNSLLQSNAIFPTTPVITFQFNEECALEMRNNVASRCEITAPDVPALLANAGMLTRALHWAETRLESSKISVDAFEFLSQRFPRLQAPSNAAEWLHQGNEQIRKTLEEQGLPVPQELQLLKTTQIEALAKWMGCSHEYFDQLCVQARGNKVWLWEQLVLMYLHQLPLGRIDVWSTGDGDRTTTGLFAAWGASPAATPAHKTLVEELTTTKQRLRNEREANEAFERRLNAYLHPSPPSKQQQQQQVALVAKSTTKSKDRLAAFVTERVKQEQFIQKMECAQYYGDVWFTK